MARLVLGPLLRYVGKHDATVWVETDAPCRVEVRAGDVIGREPTFAVAGHHYALVVVTKLAPASSTPYEVLLDSDRAWPATESTFPHTAHVRSVMDRDSAGTGGTDGRMVDASDLNATRGGADRRGMGPDRSERRESRVCRTGRSA